MFSSQIFIKFSCDNFSHRNVKVTTLWSHDHTYDIIWLASKNFSDDVIDENYDAAIFFFFQIYSYVEEAWF